MSDVFSIHAMHHSKSGLSGSADSAGLKPSHQLLHVQNIPSSKLLNEFSLNKAALKSINVSFVELLSAVFR